MPTCQSSSPPTTRSVSSGRCSSRSGRSISRRSASTKQIIVVDDCSKDRTAEIAAPVPGVTLKRIPVNGGKGRAVRAGIALATGEYLIIQDADLEYDPNDYVPMLQALLVGRADVVYGSRYMGRGRHTNQSLAAYLGGRSLSLVASLFTGRISPIQSPRSSCSIEIRSAAIDARNQRLRARSRNHGEDGAPGRPVRRSSDSRTRHAAVRKARKSGRGTGSSPCEHSCAIGTDDARRAASSHRTR